MLPRSILHRGLDREALGAILVGTFSSTVGIKRKAKLRINYEVCGAGNGTLHPGITRQAVVFGYFNCIYRASDMLWHRRMKMPLRNQHKWRPLPNGGRKMKHYVFFFIAVHMLVKIHFISNALTISGLAARVKKDPSVINFTAHWGLLSVQYRSN